MYYLIIKKYEIILYFIYIIVFLIKFIGKVFLGLVLFYEFYIVVLKSEKGNNMNMMINGW